MPWRYEQCNAPAQTQLTQSWPLQTERVTSNLLSSVLQIPSYVQSQVSLSQARMMYGVVDFLCTTTLRKTRVMHSHREVEPDMAAMF